jgi:uncharacterized membrane protein YraQ (UPF0718 family)
VTGFSAPHPVQGIRRLRPTLRTADLLGLAAVLLIAVVGLYLVKWGPYYHRAFVVAASHSLGASIISGQEATPPAPSIGAALDYAQRYFKAIWQAMVLGLLLAASIETFLPRNWLVRLLGSSTFRHTALGGVLALPGMM